MNKYRHSESSRSDFMTLLLFYILPFIAVNLIIFILVTATPKCEIAVSDTNDYISAVVNITIKSLLPTSEPTATLDGETVILTKTGRNTYSAVLKSNGLLEVDINCINKMTTIQFEQVNALDDAPPSIENNIISNNILSFDIMDLQSGVDYSSIYAIDAQDKRLSPLSVDKNSGAVTFEMEGDILYVFAKDKSGNEVRVSFNAVGTMEDNSEPEAEAEDDADITIDQNTGAISTD